MLFSSLRKRLAVLSRGDNFYWSAAALCAADVLVPCGLPYGAFRHALYPGQAVLAGVWLALGAAPRPAVWGISLTVWLASAAAMASPSYATNAQTATMLAMYLGAGALLAFPWRLMGYRWTRVSNSGPAAGAADHQYSLARLLRWTTIAAGIGFLARFAEAPWFPDFELAAMVSFAALQGTFAVGVFAHAPRLPRRAAAMLCMGVVAGYAFAIIEIMRLPLPNMPHPWQPPIPAYETSLLCLSVSFVLLVWLAVCDAAGWRIARRRQSAVMEAVD